MVNTHDTPQPHTTPTGEDTSRAAAVRYAVEGVRGYDAAEMAVELVLAHAPELRTWAADVLERRGYRAAAARLRAAAARQNAIRIAFSAHAENGAPAADTGAPIMRIPLDVELARLMVALGLPPAVVLAYWAAAAQVRTNARAGGRIRLDELKRALHRVGLRPAARTLDAWLKRGEGVLWRVHGRGRRRALYLRGHRRLCAHFTRRAALERPAAVVTNLPGKLWAVLEFDGRPLDAAAMLGRLWAAWYAMHPRTHRLSHATQRDLWNRSRHQLDAARRAVSAVRRGGYITHAHALPPAWAFPKGYRHDNGERVILPTTWAANAYAVAPADTHRRAKRSNHAAYATAADTFNAVLDEAEMHTHTHAPAIEGATGQPGRVPMHRAYFDAAPTPRENVRAAWRAIKRQRTDRARAKVGEATPRRYAAPVEVYEEFTPDEGRECVVQTPALRPHTRRRHDRAMLTRDDEDALIAAHGGRAALVASYRAPHGESVPRRRGEGVRA